MSKITVTTIAGATSGSDANKVKIESGDTLQVESNATVGGTLGVTGDATFDTSTLKVDSSNNRVGIGLTAPQELLHLKDGDIAVGNGTASNNAVIGRIGFSTDSSNSRFTGIESFRGSDAANTDLRFHTFAGDGDNGERMRIHNNGAVTKPKNPAVLAQGQSTAISTGVSNYWYVAIPEKFDKGSNYNASTGIFTAPVAGVYSVTFHLDLSSSQSGTHTAISVNNDTASGGGGYASNHAWQIRTADTLHWDGLVNLSANDTVRIVIYPDAAKNALDVNTERNHLTIHLVG